jgi:hypothetical protein
MIDSLETLETRISRISQQARWLQGRLALYLRITPWRIAWRERQAAPATLRLLSPARKEEGEIERERERERGAAG